MEALHIEAMIGAMYSQTFLSNHVGIGSRKHCLDGDFLIMVTTSSTDTGSKTSSEVSTFLLVIVECQNSTVDSRMRSIFSWKWRANSSG